MATLVHIGTERHGDSAGEHVCDLVRQVWLECRDLHTVGVRDLGDELLRDIDDAVAEGLESFHLAEELSAHHIPAFAVTAVTLMLDAELVEHIESAVLVQVFDQVERDDAEAVVMLLQLVDDLAELRPCAHLVAHTAFCHELIGNLDKRARDILGVAVGVDEQHVVEVVDKSRLADVTVGVDPHIRFGDDGRMAAFVLGQDKHIISS